MGAAKKRTNPRVGSKFVREFKRKAYELKVVKVGSGVGYELNGVVYSSPTGAAKSLTKHETSGWEFWKID
jgi:hypothetical protein